MDKLGVIANTTKAGYERIVGKIADWSLNSRMAVYFSNDLEPVVPSSCPLLADANLIQAVDGVLVLGGDGTILSVFRDIGDACKPVLGVNLGHLGFLAETDVAAVIYALECLQEDDFTLEKRLVLKAEVQRMNSPLKKVFAVNEVIIAKGEFGRIIQLDMFVGDEFVGHYTADGLILATPTGSTGYSLSAGGPIVAPHVGVILATPICAHTLAVRPLIISDRETFRVRVKSQLHNIILTVDGRRDYNLAPKDDIIVSRAHFDATLIRLKNATFYAVLRKKFKWGARETNQDRS